MKDSIKTEWLFVFLLILSCSRDYPIGPEIGVRFPLSVGNYWMLEREFKVEFSNSEQWVSQDSICWKIIDRGNLYGYPSYVLLNESYEDHYSSSSLNWYTDFWDGDYGLYNIGYSSPGGGLPLKSPKGLTFVFRGRKFSSLQSLFEWIERPYTTKGDTILRIPPRKVLEYPLTISKEWVAFGDVWLQVRKVVGKEYIFTPAGTFSCYKIQVLSDWDDDGVWDEDMEWYDWFGKNGLVKRWRWSKGEYYDMYGNWAGYYEVTDITVLKKYYLSGM